MSKFNCPVMRYLGQGGLKILKGEGLYQGTIDKFFLDLKMADDFI